MTTRNIAVLLVCIFSLKALFSQSKYMPAAENIKQRAEFQDMKFGVFIHWGLYSMLADGEWVLQNKNIDHKEYRKLASGFYPSKFDAAKWVSEIKNSGAKYICITTRHHDGFSMFKSNFSDYNIVDATPFKRDVIKELSVECKKQDIKLHLYYSHLDWDRADYPIGRTGKGVKRELNPNWQNYYNFMNNQITELLTNYGDIGAIWFDGWWDHDIHPDFNWQLNEQYEMIHKLQPACLIANNHHEKPFDGEDLQIFERDLPGQNKAGLSGQVVSALPLETCETMNGVWGYRITDNNYKSVKDIVHLIVRATGNNANLLLNIGPQPNGELPETAIERLKQVGEWVNKYGYSIYGTRGGEIAERYWGATTQKDNKIFVHILDLNDNALFLPLKNKNINKAICLNNNKTVKFSKISSGIVIEIDKTADDIDYIVELSY